MQQSLVKKLCCPFDKHDLNLQVFVKDTNENIIEGLFICTHCKRYYPIVYGVPIMTPDEYRQLELEKPVMERWEKNLEFSHVDNFRLLPTAKKE